jgi:hypothetical protein
MVLSCLVEPLIAPLVGFGTAGRRRTALSGSRISVTAIAATALLALSGATIKGDKIKAPAPVKAEQTVKANAHKRPDAIPYRVQFAHLFIAPVKEDLLVEPGEAARFEQSSLHEHRLRHKRDIVRETSPCLGVALRRDRLRGGSADAWLRFGSGTHRSGQPSLS